MAGRAPTPRPRQGVAGGSATARFAVVAARFNEAISKKLADGAVAAFTEAGIGAGRVELHWVPGSFELPLAALTLARSGRFAGIACVGVVIKGGTPHFDFICREAASGIREASLATGVPIGFGVITALTEEQAWERAGGAVGNRGEEAARAVLEMAQWLRGRSRPRRRRCMGKRRKSRELALQLLYQLDLQEAASAEPYFDEFWARHPVDAEVRAFVESLVRGTTLHQEKIDEVIAQYAENWDLDRMAVVDRNILREGVFELLWRADIPPKVAINEALEVAKKFSTRESSRFINGLLDRVHKEHRPPD